MKELDLLADRKSTRRQVVGTGVKLAYAAPLIAASFKLSAGGAAALSPNCTPGTCAEPVVCNLEKRCGCREADGSAYCLQQIRCSSAAVCASTANCPAGYVCLVTSCCSDKNPRCVPICDIQKNGLEAYNGLTDADEWVLGPGF